jgi:glutathione synthase/RimK-type ligase-like ATP-grasp enzyme
MTISYPLPVQFLMGLSDSGKERLATSARGQPQIVLTGTCSFHVHLTPGKFRLRKIFLSGKADEQKLALGPAPLVNYIADPDSHWRALAKAGELVEIDGRPCFNPPLRIAQTRRDTMARLLEGIPGLRVPVTIRIEPRHPHDFIRAATEARLRFPIIVRLAGDHGGVSTVRVDSVANWGNIHEIAWGGRVVYLTEYVDYADADGLYRKHRIVMIDGEPVLRHVIIGDQWLLHRSKRIDTPEAEQEEVHHLKHFEKETLPRISGTLAEIYRRVGLNFFGIDCHVAADGTMLLFEANATMNTLHNQPSPNRWDEPCAAIRTKLEAALEKHIRGVMAQGAKK